MTCGRLTQRFIRRPIVDDLENPGLIQLTHVLDVENPHAQLVVRRAWARRRNNRLCCRNTLLAARRDLHGVPAGLGDLLRLLLGNFEPVYVRGP
jgi:hypothetical protein